MDLNEILARERLNDQLELLNSAMMQAKLFAVEDQYIALCDYLMAKGILNVDEYQFFLQKAAMDRTRLLQEARDEAEVELAKLQSVSQSPQDFIQELMKKLQLE